MYALSLSHTTVASCEQKQCTKEEETLFPPSTASLPTPWEHGKNHTLTNPPGVTIAEVIHSIEDSRIFSMRPL